MDNFKTFQEDLASGRPAKKPVSSNLLKQRAKANEKAMKSGFMKMPDYVKKKFNEEEEMKPHKMYKGDKVVMAKNKAQHDKLNKQGYTHDDPKTKKVEEEKKNCGCGQDPCITYGKKEKVNEVSDAVKTRYVHKAMRDVDNKERASQLADKQGAPASVGKSLSKSTEKRRKGIAMARAKLDSPIKEEKQKGIDGKVCWKGYKRMGTKKKGGKTVDNCVKVEDFVLDAFENYYLTELSPKTISSYQKKAGKEYSDLKQRTMSATSREGGYHKGYISQKEYDAQHDMAAKKRQRGKGLAMSKGKGVQKEGAMKRLATDKAENERLRDKAHGALGYKKTSDTGLQKVKGGYERKRTYTREEQMQLVTNLDLDESIANLVRRGVGKVKDSLQQAGQQYKDSQEKSMKAGKGIYSNPVSGDNIRKRMKQMQSQKKR